MILHEAQWFYSPVAPGSWSLRDLGGAQRLSVAQMPGVPGVLGFGAEPRKLDAVAGLGAEPRKIWPFFAYKSTEN